MSKEYDEYLEVHKEAVKTAYIWMKNCLPKGVIPNIEDYQMQICTLHDASKYSPDEYNAYDLYFFGGNKSAKVVEDFKLAWVHHLHNNPHHWQYWVIQDEGKPIECLPIPNNYILEMICDWWSFSWKDGNLEAIFSWYDENKDDILLHPDTKEKVEKILSFMKSVLWDSSKEIEEEVVKYGSNS